MNVYVVWHIHHLKLPVGVEHRDADGHVITLDDDEDLKIIGIYSDETFAGDAIDRARLADGFREEPDCFIIGHFTVDEDKWTDGFTSS